MPCKATLKKYLAAWDAAAERLEIARKAQRAAEAEWRAAEGPEMRFAVQERTHAVGQELAAAGKAFEAARDAYLERDPGYFSNMRKALDYAFTPTDGLSHDD